MEGLPELLIYDCASELLKSLEAVAPRFAFGTTAVFVTAGKYRCRSSSPGAHSSLECRTNSSRTARYVAGCSWESFLGCVAGFARAMLATRPQSLPPAIVVALLAIQASCRQQPVMLSKKKWNVCNYLKYLKLGWCLANTLS